MGTMVYTGKVKRIKGERILGVVLDQDINKTHLETMYDGEDLSNYDVSVEFTDKRFMTRRQQQFIFAMIKDISNQTGRSRNELKNFFYDACSEELGKRIDSFGLDKGITVNDANTMVDIVLDVAFDLDVRFETGYDLLERNNEHFLFLCIRDRKCSICGKHADIHHDQGLVGVGRNRNKIEADNSKYISYCRIHHSQAHAIGLARFAKMNLVHAIPVNFKTLKRLKVGKVFVGGEPLELNNINDPMEYEMKLQNMLMESAK